MLILHDASYIVAELSYNIHAMVHFSNQAVFLFIFYVLCFMFYFLLFNTLPYGHIADYDRDESPTRILSFNCILLL